MGLSPVCFMDTNQCLDWLGNRWVGVYCGGGRPTSFGEAHQWVEGGPGREPRWEPEELNDFIYLKNLKLLGMKIK